MAKRVPRDEKPFSPVAAALIHDVQNPPTAEELHAEQAVEKPKLEVVKPQIRVVGSKPEKTTQAAPDPPPRATREKRVLLTKHEEDDFERLVRDVGYELDTSLKGSNVLRAALLLIQHSREELIKQAKKASAHTYKRPRNDDHAGQAVYEHNLAALIQTAIKNTKMLD